MNKRIHANLYTLTKILYDKKSGHFYYKELGNNRLYSNMKYPTNITPCELPEHYIKVNIYRNQGWLNALGVVEMIYVPNYIFNHIHKDDLLYISYSSPIVQAEVDSFSGKELVFTQYDHVLSGNYILEFTEAVRKYSGLNTDNIREEILKKVRWYIDTFPHEGNIESAKRYLEELEEKFSNTP